MRTLALVLLSGLMLAACANVEGDAVGECSDGADNDRDGRFDCQDPDCFGSPACAGDDDDSGAAGDDDDATGDDDDATGDDDDATGDDDDTTAGDDDDATGPIQVSGSASFDVVTDIAQFEEFECVGTAVGELDPDSGSLVGSGECYADVGVWGSADVPFDFDCHLGQNIVTGLGTFYTDNVTFGMLPDLQMTLSGSYDDAVWLVEMNVHAADAGSSVEATGAIVMEPQGN
jgi:hypothetical protein